MLSIIIPALDEAETIVDALQTLAPCRARGVEVIVVDGGSLDATMHLARPHADLVITAPRGRARQMNAGAARATRPVLLFLHADSRLPPNAEQIVLAALGRSTRVWGRFDTVISGGRSFLKLTSALMNLRSRVTGIATGDQTMFMTRAAFWAVGGFPDIALMEDVALSKRLKRISRPICLAHRALTSGRRWQRNGLAATIVKMWGLRLAYFLGANPARLARWYGYDRRE